MRPFSGVMVGLVGQAIGVHWSLAFSSALVDALCTTLLRNEGQRLRL